MAYQLVTARVDDFDSWFAEFEDHHERRAEHGGIGYEVFRASENPNDIVVLLEFESAENAEAWADYLTEEDDLSESGMSDVAFTTMEIFDRGVTRLLA